MKFRSLLSLTLFGFGAWSLWWLVGSETQKRAFDGWLAGRRAAGWVAEAAGIRVKGFPSRFDTAFRDLALADPDSGWAWTAAEFQLLIPAYRPTHLFAAWPGPQIIAAPGERVTLAAPALRASVQFFPDTDLALEKLVIETESLRAGADSGWTATAVSLVAGLRRAADGTAPDEPYDLGITATDLVLPHPLTALLDPGGALSATLSSVTIDATLAFDAVWDRHAVEGRKPALTGLAVRGAEIVWGDLRLSFRGRLQVGADGRPEGSFDVTARNWRRMLRAAVAGGVLGADTAAALETGLGVVALLSGDPETLVAPLTLSGGVVSIGPVPVGPAPVLPPPRRP